MIIITDLTERQIDMNKQSSNAKTKLKTLPSELQTQHQQYLFKSLGSADDARKLGVLSPTFATSQMGLCDGGEEDTRVQKVENGFGKQNRISVSLKQANYRGNSQKPANTDQLEFVKEQYRAIIQKYQTLEQTNHKSQQENSLLREKLSISIKKLEGRYCKKLVQILQTDAAISNFEKIDFYLQMKTFKESYNSYREQSQKYQMENEELKSRVRELQMIITNYTNKNEKKKKEASSERIAKIEKLYAQKIEQFKIEVQGQRKLRQEEKAEYEKQKFMKEEIEKKRDESVIQIGQLRNEMKDREQKAKTDKQQHAKLELEHRTLTAKLKQYEENSLNLQQQLLKSQQQLQKIQLQLSALETQSQRWRHNAESYKSMNERISEEMNEVRKDNQVLYESVENLNFEKNKIEASIMKYLSNQERYMKRISQLQHKLAQRQQQLSASQHYHPKNQFPTHPQLPKLPSESQSQRQIASRASSSEVQNAIDEKVRLVEEKYSGIIYGLNREMGELKKSKQSLESQLDGEKERYERINAELQNSYRKIEECICAQCERSLERNHRERDKYTKFGNSYGGTWMMLSGWELGRVTKVAPQLKMIKEILESILSVDEGNGKNQGNGFGMHRDKDKDGGLSLEGLIDDIKRKAEETADYFDERSKQTQLLLGRIQAKEEVISKLLKFTPEQKKGCILQYLKIMENIDEYSVDQVYKISKVVEEEAGEWRRGVNNLIEMVEENQEEIAQLRKLLNKYKSQGGVKKYQQGFQKSDVIEKYGKDQRQGRYYQCYQRRKY